MAWRALSRAVVIAWSVVLVSGCSGGGSKAGPSEPTWPVQIPKTGQTVSKAAGDDGALRHGVAWPERRFTEADGGTTMVDRLTGLMWARSITPVAECGWQSFGTRGDTEQKTWAEALEYVACLNRRSHLGHSDWRMPNRVEMLSLVRHAGVSGLDCVHWLEGEGFQLGNLCELMPAFFTSTVDPNRARCVDRDFTTWVWIVTVEGLAVSVTHSPSTEFVPAVWPVRDAEEVRARVRLPATGLSACYDLRCERIDCAGTGQDGETRKGLAWPNPRFETNDDTTVRDRLTGLVWAPNGRLPNEPAGAAVRTTWEEALAVVDGLNHRAYLGHADWRLPNVNELGTLVLGDTEASNLRAQLQAAGVAVTGDFYWSSTSGTAVLAQPPTGAWMISMESGWQISSSSTAAASTLAALLPVRGP